MFSQLMRFDSCWSGLLDLVALSDVERTNQSNIVSNLFSFPRQFVQRKVNTSMKFLLTDSIFEWQLKLVADHQFDISNFFLMLSIYWICLF